MNLTFDSGYTYSIIRTDKDNNEKIILEIKDEHYFESIFNTNMYIYVLKLIENKYYVGKTTSLPTRLKQHWEGTGSDWTLLYKPIKVLEIINTSDNKMEKYKTLEYMKLFGWKNVRGYTWCSIDLNGPPKNI